jgi:glycosyltransferase involved in cell wall biosynthesis
MGNIFRVSNLKKTIHYLKRNGFRQAYYAAKERISTETGEGYTYVEPDEETCRQQQESSRAFTVKFSILVPAYETKEEYLRELMDSVLSQTYGRFELIIADAGKSPEVQKVVESYEDKRIIYKKLNRNGGISTNTNQALMYATGDYAALLDHDDVLTRDALYEMAACIEEAKNRDIELQLLYSDEDKCSSDRSMYYEAHKKEEFNLDLIMSNNYICHFLVMKRQMMQELQLRSVCDGAQDYDLVLRAVSMLMGKDKNRKTVEELPIAHIPRVLYHWRCHEASTAENPESKGYAYDAGKRALEDFLRLRGWKGKVTHLRHLGFYRVDYEPDIFTARKDVALLGGKILDKKNKITGGIYNREGIPCYQGLHKEYSGYMHRAVLQQEAEMIDVRCMKASPEAKEILEEMTGLPYLENPLNGRFDWRGTFKEDADYQEISRRLCEKVHERKMRIVWDPAMTEKLD